MKKNEIYMIQGTDYKEMTIKLLTGLDLAADIGDKSKRIGLKPNLLMAAPASNGATTHPQLVDGVLSYLKQHGFLNLVVLESSWVGALTADSVRATGVWDVCRKHHVEFIDLQKDDSAVYSAAGMDIRICKEAVKLDYLINMPVLKGHCQTTVTCALKNSKGLIPNSEKRRFHTLGLHKPIAHLNAVIHQDFILVDNICGDLDFEEGGNPVVMNRILGFKDPVLCDSFAAECIGYRPRDIEYIRIAEKLGIGTADTSRAQVIGLSPQGMKAESQAPAGRVKEPAQYAVPTRRVKEPAQYAAPARRVKELAQYAAPKDACSACYGSLIYALGRLDEKGVLRKKPKASLAIGQGYRGEGGKIGIGQCTCCFDKSLSGCPPKAVDIVAFLEREWDVTV